MHVVKTFELRCIWWEYSKLVGIPFFNSLIKIKYFCLYVLQKCEAENAAALRVEATPLQWMNNPPARTWK